MTQQVTRILCVDDHVFFIEGLKSRLAMEDDMEVVGQLETADDVVEAAHRTNADIVLIDIEMPGADTFDVVKALSESRPQTRAIIFSAYVRDHYLDLAYTSGAWGYLSKSSSPDDVIQGIRNVVNDELAERPAPPTAFQSLSPREKQVLRLIAKGMSRLEIAEQLSRSPMTVDNHRKSIMRKLGLADRMELIRYAIAEGLVV